MRILQHTNILDKLGSNSVTFGQLILTDSIMHSRIAARRSYDVHISFLNKQWWIRSYERWNYLQFVFNEWICDYCTFQEQLLTRLPSVAIAIIKRGAWPISDRTVATNDFCRYRIRRFVGWILKPEVFDLSDYSGQISNANYCNIYITMYQEQRIRAK